MKDVALFLYNLTDNMAQPWIDAGYRVVMVDMQHPQGIAECGQITKIGADIRNGWMPPREIIDRIAFVAAFPPCDHLAVSGARWFKGKGLRKLALSVDLFQQVINMQVVWIDLSSGGFQNLRVKPQPFRDCQRVGAPRQPDH